MNFNITLVERMILESLHENKKTISELRDATKLSNDVLNTFISDLTSKTLIKVDEGQYCINKNLSTEATRELYDEQSVHTEIQELTMSCFRMRKEQSQFKLKKVYMNKKETIMYNALMKNVDMFIDSLTTTKGNISEKRVIFWGGANYENITNNTMFY